MRGLGRDFPEVFGGWRAAAALPCEHGRLGLRVERLVRFVHGDHQDRTAREACLAGFVFR